jgi:hypothetical protein
LLALSLALQTKLKMADAIHRLDHRPEREAPVRDDKRVGVAHAAHLRIDLRIEKAGF